MEENNNLDNVIATFSWSDDLVGLAFKRDDKTVHWENFSRKEQIKILNGFAQMYNLFRKILEEKQ